MTRGLVLGVGLMVCALGAACSSEVGTESDEERTVACPTPAAAPAASAASTADGQATPPPAPAAPPPATSGTPGECIPDAACGGLEQCVDHCYGERCCLLGCDCDERTGRLSCSLTCSNR